MTTTADYVLATETDRDRLYVQFDLYGERFRRAFARAMAKAGVVENEPWRAVDVACGEGLYAADLVERYPIARVVGFDRDKEAIATARMAFEARPRLEFYVADAHRQLAPVVGEGFDVAYLQFGLSHFKSGVDALWHVHQVLRPGGSIMLLDPTEQFFDYPHPSCNVLVSAIRSAWPKFGTFAAGDRHEELLTASGFVDVETEPQNYALGGRSRSGQANFANCTELLKSIREALVERLGEISAAEFDENFRRFCEANHPNLEGTTWFQLAIARKP